MSTQTQIIATLRKNSNAFMTPDDLEAVITDVKPKSVHTAALDMVAKGYLEKSDKDGQVLFRIKPDVTEARLREAKLLQDAPEPPPPANVEDTGEKKETGVPLLPRPQFEQILKGVNVDKNFIPTVSDYFFRGDIDSLTWIKEVLLKQAAGFVSLQQTRFIIGAWSKFRNWDVDLSEFQTESDQRGKGPKPSPKEGEKSIGAQMDEDIGAGYMIGKDEDGDWAPVMGGPLTYEAALAAAQRQNYIKAVGKRKKDEGEEAGDDSGTKPGARPVKPSMTFQDKFMDQMLTYLFDAKDNKGDGDNAVVKELKEQNRLLVQRIDNMEKKQQEDRMERIEGTLAQIAARDPFGDPQDIARLRQVLGVQNNTVTDNSPVVQLMKDQGARIDKNVDRLVSIFERAALHPETFNPENTRTPEDKEKAAGVLLAQVRERENSIAIRKRAFGS